MYTTLELMLAGGGLIATGIMAIVIFVLKDVFTKVGELGALKERVKALEGQAGDVKKLPEAVARIEEQLKNLMLKVEQLVRESHSNNG